MEYLEPIIEIERPTRDDVFRKSNKFDRPDFGSNIPFELFSALSNLHMSHKQDQEKDDDKDEEAEYPHENQHIDDGTEGDFEDANDGANLEDTQGTEKVQDKVDTEEESSDSKGDTTQTTKSEGNEDGKKLMHHDTVTIDAKTVSENPPGNQERRVPAEFEVQLKHSMSIEEQVIDTKQDHDLIDEKEEERIRKSSTDKSSQDESLKDQHSANTSEEQSKDKSPAEPAEVKAQTE